METDTTEEESEKKPLTQQETRVETRAVIEHNPSTSQNRGGFSTEIIDEEVYFLYTYCFLLISFSLPTIELKKELLPIKTTINTCFQVKPASNCEETVKPEENVTVEDPTNAEEQTVRERPQDENSLDSIREIHNVFVDVLNVLRRERGRHCFNSFRVVIKPIYFSTLVF